MSATLEESPEVSAEVPEKRRPGRPPKSAESSPPKFVESAPPKDSRKFEVLHTGFGPFRKGDVFTRAQMIQIWSTIPAEWEGTSDEYYEAMIDRGMNFKVRSPVEMDMDTPEKPTVGQGAAFKLADPSAVVTPIPVGPFWNGRFNPADPDSKARAEADAAARKAKLARDAMKDLDSK